MGEGSSMSSSESTAANAMLDRPRVLVLPTTLPARPEDGTPAFVASLARSLQDELELTVLVHRVMASLPIARVDLVSVRRRRYRRAERSDGRWASRRHKRGNAPSRWGSTFSGSIRP